MRELLLFLWISATAILVWWWQRWLSGRIQPKKSGTRLLLYAVLALAGMLAAVVGMSWVILHFRGFFFTR